MRGTLTSARAGLVVGLGVGLALVACQLEAPAFVCQLDTDCDRAGTCEPRGFCSKIDLACPSMRSYAPSAGDLAGECVPGEPAGTATGPEPEDGGPCDEAGDCDEGFCEATRWCSFPNDDCDSRRVYGKSDDGTLQGQCVAPHVCNNRFTDTFQDGELDDDFWDVFAFGGAQSSWLDVGSSAVRFRFPAGSVGNENVTLETADIVDMTASEVVVRVLTPPSPGLLVDLVVYNPTVSGIGAINEVYVVLFPDRVVMGVGGFEQSFDVDYSDTEYIGVQIETSSVSLAIGSVKDELEAIHTEDHALDFSRARTLLRAIIPGVGMSEEMLRAEFGSIAICSIE